MNKMNNLSIKGMSKVILRIAQSPIKSCYILLTATLILGTITSPVLRAGQMPELTIPDGFGVNIHFTNRPKDLDYIADAGLKFVRADLIWEAVEKEKGLYDFKTPGYDALTQGCTKRGIRIMYILDYSNRLYESERSVRTEQGRRAFAAFAKAAATRYKGKGIMWEIWNEPDHSNFWKPQPSYEDYTKLVKATVQSLREADSTGLILAGSLSGTGIKLEWLEQCFKRGLLDDIDGLTVHPYRPWRRRSPESVIKEYINLRNLINRYLPERKNVAVISGEWGYSLVHFSGTRYSEEQQAQYLVRMFLVNLYQKIPVSIWYKWRDGGTDPNNKSHHFGIVSSISEPKLAHFAARNLSQVLEGYSVVERLDLGNERDFALKLSKGANKAIVFWIVGQDEDQPIAFWTGAQEHQVTLPVGPGKAMLVSMFGSKTALSWKTNGLKLTISQSPKYLLIKPE